MSQSNGFGWLLRLCSARALLDLWESGRDTWEAGSRIATGMSCKVYAAGRAVVRVLLDDAVGLLLGTPGEDMQVRNVTSGA